MDYSRVKKLLIFLDESGDHLLLGNIDESYPVFGLGGVIVDPEQYSQIALEGTAFKLRHLPHEGIVLHGSEIARQKGPFTFLKEAERRTAFFEDLGQFVQRSPFLIQAVVIRKSILCEQYVSPMNPYTLSLIFLMERIFLYAKGQGYQYLDYLVESRGRKENDEIKEVFERFRTHGSTYAPVEEVTNIHHRIEFHPKARNIIGLQLADLIIGPLRKRCIPDGHILLLSISRISFSILKNEVLKFFHRDN